MRVHHPHFLMTIQVSPFLSFLFLFLFQPMSLPWLVYPSQPQVGHAGRGAKPTVSRTGVPALRCFQFLSFVSLRETPWTFEKGPEKNSKNRVAPLTHVSTDRRLKCAVLSSLEEYCLFENSSF